MPRSVKVKTQKASRRGRQFSLVGAPPWDFGRVTGQGSGGGAGSVVAVPVSLLSNESCRTGELALDCSMGQAQERQRVGPTQTTPRELRTLWPRAVHTKALQVREENVFRGHFFVWTRLFRGLGTRGTADSRGEFFTALPSLNQGTRVSSESPTLDTTRSRPRRCLGSRL